MYSCGGWIASVDFQDGTRLLLPYLELMLKSQPYSREARTGGRPPLRLSGALPCAMRRTTPIRREKTVVRSRASEAAVTTTLPVRATRRRGVPGQYWVRGHDNRRICGASLKSGDLAPRPHRTLLPEELIEGHAAPIGLEPVCPFRAWLLDASSEPGR